jgi:putative intracellular protease/amidase
MRENMHGNDTAAAAQHEDAMEQLVRELAPTPAERALVLPPVNREIAMLMYPGMFSLDLIGPLAVLGGMMNTNVHLVWKTLEPVHSASVGLLPSITMADCPADLDVLFVPGGGEGTVEAMKDPQIQAFLKDRAPRTRWVTSVCTGSLILGTAGLLRGRRATTHWVMMDVLPLVGATPVRARYVEDDNVVTAAGVSAGIDFALALAEKLTGTNYARALQLNIEYDPQPPFTAGSPAGAGPLITDALAAMYQPLVESARVAARA